jgi:hypothetical protein
MSEKLCLRLFLGQTLKRDDIINKVLQHHINHKGLPPKGDVTANVKKALANLVKSGKASNPVYGMYSFIEPDGTQDQEGGVSKDEYSTIHDTSNDQNESYPSILMLNQAEHVIGEGDSSIYMYYYETYRNYALQSGSDIWQCKIGRTETDPLSRVLSQTSTALPEKPYISIIVRTNQSRELENAIHSILKLRNRYLNEAPGDEWFMTSPEEILDIADYIGITNKTREHE